MQKNEGKSDNIENTLHINRAYIVVLLLVYNYTWICFLKYVVDAACILLELFGHGEQVGESGIIKRRVSRGGGTS